MIRAVTCNDRRFRGVKFGPGLNVILADATPVSSERDTRNGVGKSLLIDIIHFCLGADRKGRMAAAELRDLQFTTSVVIGDCAMHLSRSPGAPGQVRLDVEGPGPVPPPFRELRTEGDAARILPLREALGQCLFGLPLEGEQTEAAPTFRGLFAYISRRNRDGYGDPFKTAAQMKRAERQRSNAFLLDLNWEQCAQWQRLDERDGALRALRQAASDGLLAGILATPGALEARRVSLEDQALQLELQLREFVVLPQYREIELRADDLTRQMQDAANENISATATLRHYSEAADGEAPADEQDIVRLFAEADAVLPGAVVRRLEEVAAFHADIVQNRREYLRAEIARLTHLIEGRKAHMALMDVERSRLLRILGGSGALDEFTQLQARHSELRAQIEDASRRLDQMREVVDGQTRIQQERASLQQAMRIDLLEREDQRREAIRLFNHYSQALYESPGTLAIDVDATGLRLKAEIERQGSEGIDKMKIFCYDLALATLWSRREPSPGVLLHDSILFDGVDERQRARALELAHQESAEHGFQYICTINSDDVPYALFHPGFPFDDHIRLRLTDTPESGSLMGFSF